MGKRLQTPATGARQFSLSGERRFPAERKTALDLGLSGLPAVCRDFSMPVAGEPGRLRLFDSGQPGAAFRARRQALVAARFSIFAA
jgi:hypothetical protein